MTIANDVPGVSVEELSEAESRDLFEEACQTELGVSADEFLQRSDQGTYPAEWDVKAIQRLEFLLPFAR